MRFLKTTIAIATMATLAGCGSEYTNNEAKIKKDAIQDKISS